MVHFADRHRYTRRVASPILPNRRLTFDEYLEFEMASPLRHEFVDGEVYVIEGASRRHSRVVANIATLLHSAAAGGTCEVHSQGFRLRVGDDMYYPDVMVGCSASDTHDLWALEPCLLVEVTSPSTARIDRTNKLQAYRGIPSLRAYLIVEQAWRRIVRHWRADGGAWHVEELLGDGAITLPCPEIVLTLDQLYEGLAPLTVRELEAIGYGVEPT
jgi:Uma2 family endonuclease